MTVGGRAAIVRAASILVMATGGAACASSSSSNTAIAPRAPSPKSAAAAYAQHLVALPVLPPSARAVPHPPSMVLAISVMGGTAQIETVHRVWHVNLAPQAAAQFLIDHPPNGMTATVDEHASDSDGSAEGIGFTWHQQPLRPDLGEASLEASVTRDTTTTTASSWIYIEAYATWRQGRPANERVGAEDSVLTVSEYRGSVHGTPVRTRVVSNPRLVTVIANAFNALPVEVPVSQSCPADFGDSPVYRATFSRHGAATPDVVAVVGTFCGGDTMVAIHGRRSLTLEPGELPTLLDTALS